MIGINVMVKKQNSLFIRRNFVPHFSAPKLLSFRCLHHPMTRNFEQTYNKICVMLIEWRNQKSAGQRVSAVGTGASFHRLNENANYFDNFVPSGILMNVNEY
jgi:hypothetical protein